MAFTAADVGGKVACGDCVFGFFFLFFVRKGSGVAAEEQQSLVTRMSWGCTLSPPEVRGHGQSHPSPLPTKPVTLNGWSLSSQPSTEEAEMEKTFGRELTADTLRF